MINLALNFNGPLSPQWSLLNNDPLYRRGRWDSRSLIIFKIDAYLVRSALPRDFAQSRDTALGCLSLERWSSRFQNFSTLSILNRHVTFRFRHIAGRFARFVRNRATPELRARA